MRSGSSGSSSGGSSGSNAWRTAAAAPLSNYEFDFGNLGRPGSASRSALNKLKDEVSTTAAPRQIHQQLNRQPQQNQQQQNQRWVHKPAVGSGGGALGGSSMVGDISGKSWVPLNNSSTSTASASGSSGVVGGVGNSKADLFSDLFSTPVPKSSNTPISISQPKPSPISMSSVASALPMNRMKNAAPPTTADDPFANFTSIPKQDPPKPSAADPFEDLWRKIPAPQRQPAAPPPSSKPAAPPPLSTPAAFTGKKEEKWMDGLDNWEEEAVVDDSTHHATTELEGLPPPPAGVTGSLARDKGIEFQKQGQFADAIKWLTWSLLLLEHDDAAVLSCRASCYKEVGEYRKAVDDCCKILDMNSGDTEALLQRAFLYESMEKYKLSVQDLREVLKRDPSNRLARNTLARLSKLVD